MKYEDIDKASSLKDDYDLLIKINNEIGPNAFPRFISMYSNSERLRLPKVISEKLVGMIKDEMKNIMKQIEEL